MRMHICKTSIDTIISHKLVEMLVLYLDLVKKTLLKMKGKAVRIPLINIELIRFHELSFQYGLS